MSIFKKARGKGPDVVILHGWGCNYRHMQPIADQLVDRYRVSCFNLPGVGQSDWQYDIKTIHDIADTLLESLPEKAIYIGWSFGGLVSISLGARYPDRVQRFIGITTTPKFVANHHWPGIPLPGFKLAFSKVRSMGFKTFLEQFLDHEFENFNPKPKVYTDLLEMIEKNRDIDILLQGIDICDATDLRKEYASLKCPIDLIFGEQDEAIPQDAFEKIRLLNSAAHLHIIQGSHHMPFWTHPDEFNKILNSIL